MKVSIRDRGIYETLNPADVAAYLTAADWRLAQSRPGHSSVWETTCDGETVELLLPFDRRINDYVLRMAETVPLIAAVENRSELEVLEDLQTAGSDVVRIRCRDAGARDGTVSLDRGEALVENARELFLAGACAALNKRRYFGNLKPQQARDYVQGLRLGRGERGSYVVKILSPMPPPLRSLFPEEIQPPYQRLAVAQLSKSLAALRSAADEAMSTFQMAVFDRAVLEGVSANLCTAVVNIAEKEVRPHDEVALSFRWAFARPAGPDVPREIVIPGDRLSWIAEAARRYMERLPPEEVEIRGYVLKLQTVDPAAPPAGPITIAAVIDGQQRRVVVHLAGEQHAKAIQAYEERAEIACRGTLTKLGAAWTLQDPGRLTVLSDESVSEEIAP